MNLNGILLFLQNDSIFPPEENTIDLQSSFITEFNIVIVSEVFPDTLVVITNVFLSTVLGSNYPFTTLTWIFVFDKIAENTSPIVPEPPIPANTIWSISS